MDKQKVLTQLINLLELHNIECMEAKTLLRNAHAQTIDALFVVEVAFAIFEYARDNKIDHIQAKICKIIVDILEAMKE